MKKLVATAIAAASLAVAAPVASASPMSTGPLSTLSCTYSAPGLPQPLTLTLTFPSQYVPYVQQAIARAEAKLPGLSCSIS